MIAWIGNIMLAICGSFQAHKSFKEGHSKGLSFPFIFCWTLGEYCTFIHVLQDTDSGPLLLNYIANCIFCTIILYYKIKPRSRYE